MKEPDKRAGQSCREAEEKGVDRDLGAHLEDGIHLITRCYVVSLRAMLREQSLKPRAGLHTSTQEEGNPERQRRK
jgi:hypothetical protein